MVKGVNKTVIEINDTGNKYFERIVFFVNPDYAFMSQNKLENKAFEYVNSTADYDNFRHIKKQKKLKSKKKLFCLVFAIVMLCAVTIMILK